LGGSPQSELRRRVRDQLRESGALRGVDFEHVEAAVRALESGGSGRFAMASGVEVHIDKGRLSVYRERP